jgi:energy-coupling factor transporter ATP-binding protein EcfA2
MIRLSQVSFQYEDHPEGVFDIDLSIRAGECVVLTGPSGGGKTTLTRLINGLAPAYYRGSFSGKILVDGKDASKMPLWERGKLIGSVFQDPQSQFFSSELAGEVAFACENFGFAQKQIVSRTDRAIARFGLAHLRGHSLDTLSSGEKQRVAVASIYALGPNVYVCDEPTANLDEKGILLLAQTLKQLKDEGYTLVIAEHRLIWLLELADRFVYVKDGRIQWEKPSAQMAALTEVDRADCGLRVANALPIPNLPMPSGDGEPAIAADKLFCKRGKNIIWQDIDFAAWPGQIVAMTGENGVGKTTLALALAGLCRISGGRVLIGGAPLSAGKRRSRVWYGANDTGTQFFTDSVSSELLLGRECSERTLDKARTILKKLGLYAWKDCHPSALSGGQRQRLSVACGLLSNREVLIFDEPTSGLDGGNMKLIAETLKEEAVAGKTILLITHDSELIKACCCFHIQLKNEHHSGYKERNNDHSYITTRNY